MRSSEKGTIVNSPEICCEVIDLLFRTDIQYLNGSFFRKFFYLKFA